MSPSVILGEVDVGGHGVGGQLQVVLDGTQRFSDEFDSGQTLDIRDRWLTPSTGGSGVAAALSGGSMTLSAPVGGYSYLRSRPTFRSTSPGWLRFGSNVFAPDNLAPLTGACRFWGAGIPAATPTASAPLSSGAGFEVATDGFLYAVLWSAGVRVYQKLLFTVGDGKIHNFVVFYRPTRVYWFVDDALLASTTGPQLEVTALDVDTMPMLFLAAGGGGMSVSAVAVSDTARNNTALSDTQYPHRGAVVYPSGGLAISPHDGGKDTYTASVQALSANAAGDLFALSGSSSRVVRVTRVDVTCRGGNQITSSLNLILRSSPDAGGTKVTALVGKQDSHSLAAGATATAYSSPPTPGTAQAVVGVCDWSTKQSTTLANVWTFGERPASAIVLRGASEVLALNLTDALGTTGTWYVVFEFTEEDATP